MDTRQLEYFISIARHKNFTATAQEYFVSQPSVSHQIKNLEKEIGAPLLKRSTRTVELTREGEVFLEDAKKILNIYENSKKTLAEHNEKNKVLRIGYLGSPTQSFLPAVLQRFNNTYQDIVVHLQRYNATHLLEAAKWNKCDIYFSMADDLRTIPELTLKSIQTDHYCLVTPKNHPAIQQLSIDYTKLATEPFVFMNPQKAHAMHNDILQICRELGFAPRIVETCEVYEDVLYAVACGIGISILPYRTRTHMNSSLAYTLLEASTPTIVLALGWYENQPNYARDLFLETFRTFMVEEPDLFL